MNKLILLCISLCFLYSVSCIKFYSSSAILTQNGDSYEVSVLVDTSIKTQQIDYPFGIVELETEDKNTRFQTCEGGECVGIFMSYSIPNYDISSGGSSTSFNGNSATRYEYNDGDVPVTIITSNSNPRVIYQVTQGGDVGRTITFNTFDDNTQESFIETPDCGNVVCNDAIEIMLVLDSSGSIDEETEFEDEKQFARDIVNSFSIANDAVRVGIITFATDILLQTPLSGDKDALLEDITSITRQGGQTNIGGALNEAHNQLLNARGNIPHIIIIVTDGKANRPEPPTNPITYMVEQANEAKNDGILIYAIGVGNEVEESDLDLIASGEDFRSHVDNFDDLETTIKSIQGEICTGGSSDGCTSSCDPDEFCGCNICLCAITQEYCGERGTLDTTECGCISCVSPYTNINDNDCSECLAEFACQNGGTQNSDCSCSCPTHTSGDRCENCNLECNGFDELPDCGGCNCDFPFSGNGCLTCDLCSRGSSANEACTECTCNGDLTGEDCDTCNLDCGNGVEKISSYSEGTCYCDCTNNWEDSETGECNYCEPCVNGVVIGSCNGCTCTDFWSGDHCELCNTDELSSDCSNHGKITNDGNCNSCTCTVGDYEGTTCQTCPYDCGTGSHNNGCTACNCVSPYIDDVNTAIPDCSVCDTSADIDYCNNRGFINTTLGNGCDTCECTSPFTGKQCQTCSFCQNGGTPNDDCNNCNCPNGWSGNDCSICIVESSDYCNNKGNITDITTCDSCTCEDNYIGNTCNSCDYNCNDNGDPVFETCDSCNCYNFYDETTDCAECTLDCKNESTENGDCSACNCKEGTGFEGLECDNCPDSYFGNCQNNAIELNKETCTCNCSDLWSGAVCNECEILDSCGNITQGAPIHPGISPGHCYCECAGFWEGEHCDRCSLEFGAECPGIAEYTPGNCTCHCPDYYEDIEGCDICILKEEDCAPNMEPLTSPNLDPSVCACQCIGGWTGRDCQTCPVTCDEKLGLYFDNVTCTCNPVCGDNIVAEQYEECEPPNKPCCDAECHLIEGSCDNGDKCTKNDYCELDECITGVSVDCDKGNKCIEYSCDPDTGCIETDISGECDDKDDCTTEYCDPDFGCRYSGVDCDDSDVCTRDYCLRNGGCQHEDLSGECNDFNVCTTDSCDPANGCSNVVSTTCEPRNACETAECDPVRGCVYFPIECPGSSTDLCKVPVCDENTGCYLEDFSCPSDGDLCTDEKCNPDTGSCTSTEIVCDDENTDDCIISYCDAGDCVSSSEPDCDDGNPCTNDSCENFNCVHTPIVCNSEDACFPQVCIDGECVETPIECPDSDADCEGTICVNGECVPKNDNNCDDGNPCTIDVCREGICDHTSEKTCDDDNLCTLDSCDLETGECTNTIIDTDCVNDACFERKCDPATGNCIVTSIVDCSIDDVCASGECNPDTGLCEVTEFDCDDGLFCTIDICEEDENENPSCRHEQRVCPQTSDLCVVSICSEDSDSCEELSVVCASEDECIEGECIDGNCVFRRLFGCGVSAVPDPLDPVAIEDPFSSSSTLIIPVAGIVNNAAAGGDSGAVANEASAVLANNYSTTVVAVGGVGLVITFAFFAAVLGFNNSKQQPEVPLDALLDQTEADMVAFDNPLGTTSPDANLNIATE